MNKKVMLGFLAIFVLGIIGLAGLGYAYKGDPSVKGPNYDADIQAQLEAAMDANDYDAWLQVREDNNLPTRGKIFSVITEENFDLYVEMHEANLAGDYETADEIRSELGLGQGSMKRAGSHGQMKGQGSRGSGSGQRMNSFVDSDNNGVCDNYN